MGKIHVLPEDLANQIAAGEVVERPASVVKELVENALDARSTRIIISLQEGGLSLIRVRDNGKGMARNDVERAFMRHATSKIASKRDLFRIRSLGFRGEALPSIAAVSMVDCRTGTGGERLGTRVVWKGGHQEKMEEIAHLEGTDIRVSHLFYNTPARLKHLKTVNTEISHVANIVNRLAFAKPDVSFQLEHEGRTLIHTLGDGQLIHVIQAIYGQTVARAMLQVEADHMDFTLKGYIGKPELTRASRHYISLIVNGRYVRNYPLTQAVLAAYDTLLPIHRMPLVVLSLEMDPQLVDVNVHPAKLEVRFSKEKELQAWLTEVIREKLLQASLIPQIRANPDRPARREVQVKMDLTHEKVKEAAVPYENPPLALKRETMSKVSHSSVSSQDQADTLYEGKKDMAKAEQDVQTRIPELTPLAQVHGTYIVAQSEDSLFLIDQHAAHERVYYERFRRELEREKREQQDLLFPIHIELTAEESEALKERHTLLDQVGIQLEPFGPETYIVRSHPVWFPDGEEEALIRELIDWVLRHRSFSLVDLREEGAKQMACKAAIKANRHLRHDEMQSLLVDLREASNPFTCPHGRPILIEFTLYEMEKMFKRIM